MRVCQILFASKKGKKVLGLKVGKISYFATCLGSSLHFTFVIGSKNIDPQNTLSISIITHATA